jgi:peptidoglycan/xylan/chitin deacetylase (PgdA/CDA1 family)
VDIQLHTHRHRTPRDRDLFLREIEDNRNHIRDLTGKTATHFCYPSGDYDPAFLPWLKEAGIVSATTCDTGLASPHSDPLLLPRMLDVSSLSSVEFEGWLTGISAAFPRRNGINDRREGAAP